MQVSVADLALGRQLDVDAPLRETMENISWEVAGDRSVQQRVEEVLVEPVDPLRRPPRRESPHSADVERLRGGASVVTATADDRVRGRQGAVAPFRPLGEVSPAPLEESAVLLPEPGVSGREIGEVL